MTQKFRMVGRAVECGGLENRCGGDSTGGSNPSPSASNKKHPLWVFYFYLWWSDETPEVRPVGERDPWSENEHGNYNPSPSASNKKHTLWVFYFYLWWSDKLPDPSNASCVGVRTATQLPWFDNK